MSVLDQPACTNCGKHASDLTPKQGEPQQAKMLVCARCQSKAQRLVHYCSRDCQVAHYKAHKPICGVDLAAPTRTSIATSLLDRTSSTTRAPGAFEPPEALLFHLAALGTLPPSAWPAGSSPPSFLFFPTPPVHKAENGQAAGDETDQAAQTSSDEPSGSSSKAVTTNGEADASAATAPEFIPIVLPAPARNLFNCIQLVAYETANPISVNLMYSVLLDEVAALGGAEQRLVEQLASEYRLDDESVRKAKEQAATAKDAAGGENDGAQEGEKKQHQERRSRFRTLREVIDDESEPSVEELFDAIGGQKNTRILVDWQVYESERKRTARQQQEQENKGRKGMRKGRR